MLLAQQSECFFHAQHRERFAVRFGAVVQFGFSIAKADTGKGLPHLARGRPFPVFRSALIQSITADGRLSAQVRLQKHSTLRCYAFGFSKRTWTKIQPASQQPNPSTLTQDVHEQDGAPLRTPVPCLILIPY